MKRKRWARRPGNDGLARVGVPEEVFTQRPDPGDRTGHDPADDPSDAPGAHSAHDSVVVPGHDPVGAAALDILKRHVERLELERLEQEAIEPDSELERLRTKAGRIELLEALNEMMENRSRRCTGGSRSSKVGPRRARPRPTAELMAARESLARAEAMPPRRRWDPLPDR